VAVALALIGRADALAGFAATPRTAASGDREAAARDYREAIAILEALQAEGAIEGTDVDTLTRARGELDRLSK